MAQHPIISVLESKNGFFTDIKAGNHQLIADEPEDMGGTDKAADPLSIALSALGACTAMTLKIYFAHKKLNWEKIEVHITHELLSIDKNSASDELIAMANNGKVRKLYKKIYIKSDMEDKLLNRASIIAEKCPVNLMMKRSCPMETEVIRL
ncbi:putative redox protein [Cyclonatronum proteinivorum]|uniref:Putative redox protein n=1 Tax=Cyclonatronum proteinivorum TaxID=1457365 RepID=A0A345UIM3_9BACT|nr:OsmC family protein [Cyclonatronum proteinivorum]AXJ00325.1 putative redox protein [Cyclonatronum proteinivorum]